MIVSWGELAGLTPMTPLTEQSKPTKTATNPKGDQGFTAEQIAKQLGNNAATAARGVQPSWHSPARRGSNSSRRSRGAHGRGQRSATPQIIQLQTDSRP